LTNFVTVETNLYNTTKFKAIFFKIGVVQSLAERLLELSVVSVS